MNLRTVCNVAYALLAENRDADELAELDALLEGRLAAQPGKTAPDRAGMNALMAAMSMAQKG